MEILGDKLGVHQVSRHLAAVEAGRETGISLTSGWEVETCESRNSHLEMFSFK